MRGKVTDFSVQPTRTQTDFVTLVKYAAASSFVGFMAKMACRMCAGATTSQIERDWVMRSHSEKLQAAASTHP